MLLLLLGAILSSTASYEMEMVHYNNLLELKCESYPGRSLFHKSYCYLIIEVDEQRCSEVMPVFEIVARELTDKKLKELRLLGENETTYTRGNKEYLNEKEQLCVLTKTLYCPPNSELVGTKCFYLNKERRSYEEAINDCEYKGMKMFYPHSDKDIRIVIELTANSGLSEIWMSAVRDDSGIWEMNDGLLSMFDYARWFDTSLFISSTTKLNTKLSIGNNASTPIGYMSVEETSSVNDLPSVCFSISSLEPIDVPTTLPTTTTSTTTTTTTTTTESPCEVNAHQSSSGCECDDGYVDILDTSIPDKSCYNMRGMKCFSGDPCHLVADPLSIVFVIDSSGSIGSAGWPDLLSFIEKAGPLIPKTSRIGFVKFSSNVSAKLWLNDGWTDADFLNGIPREFDAISTDTPGGILAAIELLQSDQNQRQTIVLITDGVPNQPHKYSGDPGLKNAMANALSQLHTTRAKLLVVGFGKQLVTGRATIESWLNNPSKDYFAYHEEAKLMTSDHMKNVLSAVCQQ